MSGGIKTAALSQTFILPGEQIPITRVTADIRDRVRELLGGTQESFKLGCLNPKEKTVLGLVMYDNSEIVAILGLKKESISSALKRISVKLNSQGKMNALLLAILDGQIDEIHFPAETKAKGKHLNPEDEKILRLLALDYVYKEIASAVYSNQTTVKRNISAIFRKLEVANGIQAVLVWLWCR